MGNRIYGCDDCLAVCPWNKFASGRAHVLNPREELAAPRLAELARLDDAAFRALFRKSPVKRIGRERFVRNVLIAIGNSGDAALAQEARALLGDPSPLVRGAAVWALAAVAAARSFAALAGQRARAMPTCWRNGALLLFSGWFGGWRFFLPHPAPPDCAWPRPGLRRADLVPAPPGNPRARRRDRRCRAGCCRAPPALRRFPGFSFSAASTSARRRRCGSGHGGRWRAAPADRRAGRDATRR